MFTSKPLRHPQSLGEYLRQQRTEQRLKLPDIEQKTKISARYLDAIERGAYHRLPAAVLGVQYVRRYAATLNIPWKFLEGQFADELARYRASHLLPSKHSVFGKHRSTGSATHEHRALLIPRYLKMGAIGIFILCVALYFLWSLVKFVSPPELAVTEPAEDRIVTTRILIIHGTTEPAALVEMNGQSVSVNTDGSFTEELSLLPGLNVIRISAKTKHSTERVVMRNILYNIEN